jgi:cytidylate kinase
MNKYSNHKLEAIRLRKQGLSYLCIARKLSASKGCIRNWAKDIKLTDHQVDELRRSHISSASSRLKQIQRVRNETSKTIREKLDQEGIEDVKNISDPLFFIGLGLY